MPHLREHISPSQLKTAKLCMRRWAAQYCYGMTEPEGPALARGKRVHAFMEQWGRTAAVPPPDTLEGRVALALMSVTPIPETPGLVLEQEILVPTAGKPFFGFIDYIVMPYKVGDRPGEVGILVGDHKTTSDFGYALSEEQLRADAQALIYSAAGIEAFKKRFDRPPDFVQFQHTYGRTKGAAQAMAVPIFFTPAEVAEGVQGLEAFALEMLAWQNTPLAEIPPTEDACGMYPPNGCHLRAECAKLGLNTYGNRPEDEAINRLRTTRLDAIDLLTTGALMGKFTDTVRAVAASAPHAAPKAPEPLPVVEAALEDLTINPPDGDATGASNMTMTADALVATTVDAEADPEEGSGYLAAPDPGEPLAPQPTVAKEPQTTAAAAAGVSRKHLQEAVTMLLAQAAGKPAVLAKLEEVAKADQRMRWLLTGKTSGLRTAEQWQALKDVLEAAIGPGAAVPAPTPKAVAAPTPDTDNHENVKAALQVEQEATVTQVEAKRAVIAAQAELKKIVDAEDDDKMMAYRAEVLVPAKQALTQADAAVVQAQQAVADARARAMAEAVASAAKVQHDAEVVDKAQDVVVAPAVEQPPAGRGLPLPILLIGAFPVRQSFVHISDLLMPYAAKVQATHHVAHYSAIRADGANKVVEALVADLHTGVLELPDLVVAHAVPMHLESRALEAIRPFFATVLEAAR